MNNRAELKRLLLQIERDVLAQTQFLALLRVAGAALAGRRRELRALKVRIAKDRSS